MNQHVPTRNRFTSPETKMPGRADAHKGVEDAGKSVTGPRAGPIEMTRRDRGPPEGAAP